ncbi:proline-rich receptor-like protein kinase PERK2 [Spinacia oleracea]|uniref:Proline-rich receptor-like protein kinase PERK2 n=1 Tax=Spinacia oleracea TaxID=3562 RepID=A0ABM3REK3_SPIOL|nr:proline-rich receptor-like protein kinase PERK2 [Spinacia oleracea]
MFVAPPAPRPTTYCHHHSQPPHPHQLPNMSPPRSSTTVAWTPYSSPLLAAPQLPSPASLFSSPLLHHHNHTTTPQPPHHPSSKHPPQLPGKRLLPPPRTTRKTPPPLFLSPVFSLLVLPFLSLTVAPPPTTITGVLSPPRRPAAATLPSLPFFLLRACCLPLPSARHSQNQKTNFLTLEFFHLTQNKRGWAQILMALKSDLELRKNDPSNGKYRTTVEVLRGTMETSSGEEFHFINIHLVYA